MEQDEARCEIRPNEMDVTLICGYGWIKMDQDGARWSKMELDGARLEIRPGEVHLTIIRGYG